MRGYGNDLHMGRHKSRIVRVVGVPEEKAKFTRTCNSSVVTGANRKIRTRLPYLADKRSIIERVTVARSKESPIRAPNCYTCGVKSVRIRCTRGRSGAPKLVRVNYNRKVVPGIHNKTRVFG